jgi:hypothetical protein
VFEGSPDGAQQRILTEWLRQEFDSPRLHGLNRHGHVAVASDEDDRHVSPFDSDALLQFETVEAWKRKIQHQAARNESSWTGKEFLRRKRRSPAASLRSGSTIPAIRARRCHRRPRRQLVPCLTEVVSPTHGKVRALIHISLLNLPLAIVPLREPKAERMVWRSCSSLKGLPRKAAAPACIAR